MEHSPEKVAAVGLWEGVLFGFKHKDMQGTLIRVLSGRIPPSSNSLIPATFGPYKGCRDRNVLFRHDLDMFVDSDMLVRMEAVACPYHKKYPDKYAQLGIDVGAEITMAKFNLLYAKRPYSKLDTALLFHIIPPPPERFQGLCFDIESCSWANVTRQTQFVKFDNDTWALPFPTDSGIVRSKVDYINDTIASIGGLPMNNIQAAYDLVTRLDMAVAYDVLRGIIRTRPESVEIAPSISVHVDLLHILIATKIIESGMSMYETRGTFSGTFRYAFLAANELYLHRYPYPEVYAAISILAQNDSSWKLPSNILANCVMFNRMLCGDIGGKPYVHQYTLNLCRAIGIDGPRVGYRYVPVKTAQLSYQIFKFSFAKYTFFETDSIPYAKYEKLSYDLRSSMKPWELEDADFSNAQLREWLGSQAPLMPRIIEPGFGAGTRSYTFNVSIGWLSSLLGMREIFVDGINLLVSMNLFAIDGEPLVIRQAVADADDTPESTKVKARACFMNDLKSNQGYHFKHAEKTPITEITPKHRLRLTDTGPEIVKFNTDMSRIVQQIRFQTEVPISRNYPLRGPENPNQDWRSVRIVSPAIAENADRIVADIISTFSDAERRRAVVLIRHFNKSIELQISPIVYEEDRVVYMLLCAISALFPPALTRKSYGFDIADGVLYWSVVKTHLPFARPTHYKWNISHLLRLRDYNAGNFTALTEDGKCLQVSNFEIPEMCKRPVSYVPTCVGCTDGIPVIRQACGHVLTCEKCASKGIPPACQICNQRTQPLELVVPAPFVETDGSGTRFRISKQVNLFSWQQAALNKLCTFAQRAEIIWLPPGSGKTETILRYIRFCNSHECMTKYVLWSTVPVAIPNLIGQCQRAEIPCVVLKRGEMPHPGVISIIKNSDIIKLDMAILGPRTGDMTFILDEFHTCMSRKTMVASACLEIAKCCTRTIPMSGTVYKNHDSPGELASFLGLCVNFPVTVENYKTALGLLISYRVPPMSVIRRIPPIEIEGLSANERSGRSMAEIQDKEKSLAEAAMIEFAIKSVTEEEIGCVAAVASYDRGLQIAAYLNQRGIRACVQNSSAPINIRPTDCPDPRGPGIIAKSQDSVNAGIAIENLATESVANESWRLPQIILVPLRQGFTEGYDINRYRRMLFTVLPCNDATLTQLEGRIDRVNNDAKFIEYYTFVAPCMHHLYLEHEKVRAKADALRDIQESNDSTRRIYDHSERDRRKAEADDARKRANEEQQSRASSHSPEMQRIAGACAILNIPLNPVKGAFLSVAKAAKKELIFKWHPDKWSGGSDEEKAFAMRFASQINMAFDIIEEYCSN